jgi:hypothetical protein
MEHEQVRTAAGMGRVVIPLLLLTMVGVALAPIATGVPSGNIDSDTDFRAFMEPRLAALLDASEKVDEMAGERSRNVLALRAESQRIEALVEDIDAYLARATVPAWAEPVVADYRAGRDLILSAIDTAYEALSSFDFSSMPEMVPLFAKGTDLLENALSVLRGSRDGAFVVHL